MIFLKASKPIFTILGSEITSSMKKTMIYSTTKLTYAFRAVLSSSILIFCVSCASEYHWVKVKSADPVFAKKMDSYAALPASDRLDSVSSLNFASSKKAVATFSPMFNKNQLTLAASSLSPQLKAALTSNDLAVRKQALKETFHQELSKDAAYSKLGAVKKQLIEHILVNKVLKSKSSVKSAAAVRNSTGLNNLLLAGLIVLAVGLLLSIVSTPVGLIFIIIGLVLAILGLVELLG